MSSTILITEVKILSTDDLGFQSHGIFALVIFV